MVNGVAGMQKKPPRPNCAALAALNLAFHAFAGSGDQFGDLVATGVFRVGGTAAAIIATLIAIIAIAFGPFHLGLKLKGQFAIGDVNRYLATLGQLAEQ